MVVLDLTADFKNLVNGLIYECYKYNRTRALDIPPDKWAILFKNTETLERRYQAETGGTE